MVQIFDIQACYLLMKLYAYGMECTLNFKGEIFELHNIDMWFSVQSRYCKHFFLQLLLILNYLLLV